MSESRSTDLPDASVALSRRTLIGLGAASAIAGTVATSSTSAQARPTDASIAGGAPAAAGVRAISMAMHVHGSFSEGKGSMQNHLHQAEKLGVDVIWWTDHDFRIMASGYRTSLAFDGLQESEAGLDWDWHQDNDGAVRSPVASFVTDPHTPSEPGRALRMSVSGPDTSWGEARWTGQAQNHTYTTSLAQTVLSLDVYPQTVGDDAQLFLEVRSSIRPATSGRPAGRYSMQYRVGGRTGHWTEGDGLAGVIGLSAAPGAWTRVSLDLQADVEALWPDLVSGDAGLCQISVGVRARRGATAAGLVDRLRFERGGRGSSDAALRLRQQVMNQYAAKYPSVRQHPGSELSMVRHMNTFGSNLRLPDYGPGRPRQDTSLKAAQEMVRFVQANGCIVQLNHPLAYSRTAEELAIELIDTDAMGADAIEIGGRGSSDAQSAAFDAAARNSVFVTATGTNDDHNGIDWLTGQRWVTSVWARSTDEQDLFTAIRGGRAWFWDPAYWRGEMEITVDGVGLMGSVRITADTFVEVRYTGSAPPSGGSIVAVTGVVDNAGSRSPTGGTTRRTVTWSSGGAVVGVDTGVAVGSFVRFEIRGSGGALVGFSNPVWLLRRTPKGGVPALRQSI